MTPADSAPASAATASFAARRGGSPLPRPVLTADDRHSRWAKSENSFGPFGRVAATFALLVPLALLLATVFTGIGIVGAGIYGFVIVPWGLKDIWKKTKVTPRSHEARR